MTRRRKLLAVLILAVPILCYAGWAGAIKLFGPPHEFDTLVGRTETQVLGNYGTPKEDLPGYHSLARYTPPRLPPGPIRTLIFEPRGLPHPEGGTLWVWLTERDGEWVCFQSWWFANGVNY